VLELLDNLVGFDPILLDISKLATKIALEYRILYIVLGLWLEHIGLVSIPLPVWERANTSPTDCPRHKLV